MVSVANRRPPNMRVQRTRSSPSAPHSPLTRYPLGAGMVCIAVAALMTVAASEPPATRTPGTEARDAAVVQRALVQSGSVETYFGMSQSDDYVVVVPVAQASTYRRDWRDVWVAALAEAGGRSAEVQSALSDLEARGQRPWSTPVIDWGSHLRLGAEDPFTAYRRDGTWTDVYPGALGVISVAAPGFSGSGRTAVVYWTRTHTVPRGYLLYGQEMLTCLERGQDRWHIKWEVLVRAA